MKDNASNIKDRIHQAIGDSFCRQNPGISVEKGYLQSFELNLLPNVDAEDIASAYRKGAGKELEKKARAIHSSSILVMNTFAPFRNHPKQLVIDGFRNFEKPNLEYPLPSGLDGIPPHLDVFISAPDRAVAVESKFTEPLQEKKPEFRDSYFGPRAKHLPWDEYWRQEMQAVRDGKISYRYLDAAQLIKHAFGLSKWMTEDTERRSTTLLYLYWMPTNGNALELYRDHAAEIRMLRDRVSGGSIRFCALTYSKLWDSWDSPTAPAWLKKHVGLLRARYEVAV